MGRPTPWKDEYTLLCEQCGYVLESLDHSLPCPECGKPIEESLPKERSGTPWQRKYSLLMLIATWFQTIRHPKATFDHMISRQEDGMSLTAIGLVCSLVGSWLLLITLSFMILVQRKNNTLFSALISIFSFIFFWLVAYIYAWFGSYRLRAWAKNRYRISKDAAWSIVGHSSIGLCLPPLMFMMTMICFIFIFIFDFFSPEIASNLSPYVASGMILASILSFPVGLVYFELLCSIGVKRCKFRNTMPLDTHEESEEAAEP